MEGDKDIFLLTQLEQGTDDPGREDLYEVGVVAQVLQLLKLPDGTVRVLIEGQARARLASLRETGSHVIAEVELIDEETVSGNEVAAMMRSAASLGFRMPPAVRRLSSTLISGKMFSVCGTKARPRRTI